MLATEDTGQGTSGTRGGGWRVEDGGWWAEDGNRTTESERESDAGWRGARLTLLELYRWVKSSRHPFLSSGSNRSRECAGVISGRGSFLPGPRSGVVRCRAIAKAGEPCSLRRESSARRFATGASHRRSSGGPPIRRPTHSRRPTTVLAIEARHKTPLRRDGWIPRCEALRFGRRMCRRPGRLWRHRSCWLPGLVHRRRRVSFRSNCKRRRADRTERRRPPRPGALHRRQPRSRHRRRALRCWMRPFSAWRRSHASNARRSRPALARTHPILSNGRNHRCRYSTVKRRDRRTHRPSTTACRCRHESRL